MRLLVENRGKRYEVVKCGKRCSFAKKDGNRPSCILTEWESTHCTNDCYLPKWWRDNTTLNAIGGLREITPKRVCPNKWTCSECANLLGGNTLTPNCLKHEVEIPNPDRMTCGLFTSKRKGR